MSISFHPATPEGRTLAATPPQAGAPPSAGSKGAKIRSRLFTKYVALFVAVVAVALLSNGIFEVFFYYREHKAALIRIQHEQAEAAAAKISQFVKEIESQLGWTTQLPWPAASVQDRALQDKALLDRRFDALRLLKQVPAVTELAQVDSTGKERLRVSRLAMDGMDGGGDFSKEPKFTEAVARKVYYGPVYFRRESEPYMTLSVAGTRKDGGVSIAEVNLKLIWDVVSRIKVGESGHAYVVGSNGRLIAHPDISLVLRNTDMSKLAQVQAALTEQARLAEQAALSEQAAQAAQSSTGPRTAPPPPVPRVETTNSGADSLQGSMNIQGQEVLTASAPIAPLGWIMFVELPVKEAYASLYAALQRLAIVLLAASIFAVLAGIFLARRMVGPIQALRTGAERIGGGDFAQRINIKTGDELEGLANQFNDMGARLQESYADLENKVEQRTAELSESLEQQTATSEILQVISNSLNDTQPVFDAIVQSGLKLFPGALVSVALRYGDTINAAAVAAADPARVEAWRRNIFRTPLARNYMHGGALLDRRIVDIPDAADAPAEFAAGAQNFLSSGNRAITIMPMMRGDDAIGLLTVVRLVPGPLSDKQLAVLRTFANQAVIAIENTRLLKELRQRTDDLSESLEQQTATAEILSSISASMTDTKPVFDAIVRNLRRLFGTRFAVLQTLREDGMVEMPAVDGDPGFEKLIDRYPRPLAEDTVGGLAMLSRHPVQFAPVLNNPATPATTQQFARDFGFNSVNFSPMLLGDRVIGAIGVARQESAPFDEKQVALIGSFANQAVIAIENTRLLKELRQRTDDLSESLEQQTATSEVLQVISSTPGDLEPVFKTMLENATRICGANFGQMNLYEDGSFRPVAYYNVPAAYGAYLAQTAPFQPHPHSGLGTVARTRQVVHVADIRTLPAYLEGNPSVVAISDLAGARSYFVVPMLKENELIGAITIYRQEVKPFAEKQTEVVANFASQAVIAIENARLLNELRERTTELSRSLDDLRTAQDRLVQTEKLASLGQLTAGIAHEIKNPLNFVNNFSSLSTELIDELNDVLKDTKIDDKTREEIDELTHMLKGNLEKVVQHGKRADSIVKNMLLHSREGSGEHRPADINAIVEESLNLAYHGARAEKSGFNITLKRDLDPAAGMIDVFPQEITRVFLNLISNGFYAATKRKEAGDVTFEPMLSATTKSLGNKVEIRIRDNGTGIPQEVKEKIFNPFFTTKPAGEGTGLGLSMSHDIVVKQHSGKIDVDTEPGAFTEFIITLPRNGAAEGIAGGKS